MTAVSAVLAGLEATRPWQEELYRDVHQHPELSHQETRTAGLVAERLRGAGFEVHEQVGGTGVVGVLRNGAGATVLLRADMDALPVREATGLPYASQVTTTDADGREVPVDDVLGPGTARLRLLAPGRLAVRPEGGPEVVVADVDGALTGWLRQGRAVAVVVRPDRIVLSAS